jgi:hypothetical protein
MGKRVTGETTVKSGDHKIEMTRCASLMIALSLVALTAACGGGGGGGGGTTQNPVPNLTSISPAGATAGGAAFTLTVNGSSFVSSSVVRWNGANRATTFASASRLTASIPASDFAGAGSVSVTVFNPSPGGGLSNSRPFTITISGLHPVISALSPATGIAGAPGLSLTIDGTGFEQDSQVLFDGHPIPSTLVDATQLSASVPAADIQVARTVQVAVNNPPFDGTLLSNIVLFPIENPHPQISSLTPSSVSAGSAGFLLKVMGTGFVAESVLQWNGADRLTVVLSSTELEGNILASDVSNQGTAQITVSTGSAGTSDPLVFTIRAPSLGRNDTRATATPISNGIIVASISPYGDEDFYSFHATSGATVTAEITARRLPSPSQLDSAIEIVDSAGSRPTTCRSPDRPRDPITFEVIDPTPTAFDDECVNDDIIFGVLQDSKLEFQPSATGTFYVHVVDLRGDGRPDLIYELSLSGAD